MAKKATGKGSEKERRPKRHRRRYEVRHIGCARIVEQWRQTIELRRTASIAGEAFMKLLQSPLVAELVAVAATAALAALAEQGFSQLAGHARQARRQGGEGRRQGGGGRGRLGASAPKSTKSRKAAKAAAKA